MREILLSLSMLSIPFFPVCACAQDTASAPASQAITAPTEVGTTSMPPGEYIVTDQLSAKTYYLTVSSKGTMILGPAPVGAASTAAAIAPGAATAAAATPTSAVKGLMEHGMEKGAGELMKLEGKGALQNLLK